MVDTSRDCDPVGLTQTYVTRRGPQFVAVRVINFGFPTHPFRIGFLLFETLSQPHHVVVAYYGHIKKLNALRMRARNIRSGHTREGVSVWMTRTQMH